MLLNRVAEEAAHLHEREVGAELLRVEGGRGFGHAEILLASNFN
jgi:hypothetical protein